jgi:dienelactone hydrolase
MCGWFLRVALVVGAAAAPVVAAGPTAVWLTAADGVEVRGDLYARQGDDAASAPVVLLFHQAGSNRGEYAEIAPRLNAMGFHALAIDQRSGGERWGFENETVAKLGESTDYLAALPDLVAALKWKAASGYRGKTLVWGSSYSAALVFLLAAEHREIDGVLAFSPGEYLGTRTDEVRKAAKAVSKPVLVLTPADERDRAKQVVDVLPGEDKGFVIPDDAVHGSSMLVPARNAGAEEVWPLVRAFLERFAG